MNAFVMGMGFLATLVLAIGTWLRSRARRDVSIIDSMWPWLICAPGVVAMMLARTAAARGFLILVLAGLWAVRLSAHITLRHRGHPEDHRYQAIRARNQPDFEWKSLYLVFGLQAALGWIVAMPLVAAATRTASWHVLDVAGAALFAFGFLFEAIADAQLTRFRANAALRGQVLDSGLWRYSRHPNYFGECCVWWGLWLIAASTGAWWTIVSPLLMTVLLLKVSGVALLESGIATRRPAYASYIRRTSAFFPRPHAPEPVEFRLVAQSRRDQ